MTTEKNLPVPATTPKVELPVLAQQKVLALHAARAVVHTQGSIFGGSSVPDTAGVGGLITIADYILAQPEEPDVTTAEEAAKIPNVTEKIGATFATQLGDAVLQDILGPGVRIRKTPTEREVELPAGVETLRYGSEPGYWIVAADRPLMAEFEDQELDDAIRDWPGLQSAKGNPIREVTNGVVIGKQVFDSFVGEWVSYHHNGPR